MASILKFWWVWLGAGLGVVAVFAMLAQPPAPPAGKAGGQPAAGIETARPETTAQPQPPGTVTAGDQQPATSPAPELAPTTPGPTPDLPQNPAVALGAQPVPLLTQSSPPLSLAQVLPPGQAPKPGQIAPSFDLVRVAPDGNTVIAGRAAPGANVQIFSGNVPIGEATASPRGEFVAFLSDPASAPPVSQIEGLSETAALVVSQEDIIILPRQPDTPDAAPIVLRRTPDEVQVLQPAGPAIPSNISLDLVSYSPSGAVKLAGRGQPGNVARIYANGVLAGEALIAAGGNWGLEISDLAEGRYVLRVDEITPSGQVASRTESPFQREFPAAEQPGTFLQGARVIVQPGNTLWLMATEAYGDGDAYTQIFSANKDAIRDPDLIYPGQIFSIPRVEE